MAESAITVTVDPFLLPTAQHRAGLAGLMVLTETMRRRDMGPVPEIQAAGEGRYTVALSAESLQAAMNDLYDATWQEQPRPTPLKDKAKQIREPKREEKVLNAKTGKEQTVYIYDVVVPRAAFLSAMGMPDAWLKLWRDAFWSTIRGVPKTRLPFEARAGRSDVDEGSKLWAEIGRRKQRPMEVAGSLMIGAQAATADNVPFQGRPAENLLLHFWPVVAGAFQATVLDREGNEKPRGYVLAVPDVIDFASFAEDFPEFVGSLSSDVAGYRPRGAIISIPEEAGLEYAATMSAIARARHRESSQTFSTAGVETYYLEKRGNNIPVLHAGRVPVDAGVLQSYDAIRNRYTHPVFKRQLILNLLRGSGWYTGFADVFACHPWQWFVGGESGRFQRDIRRKVQLTQEALRDG